MPGPSNQTAKEKVGCIAAGLVRSGMHVGLGTGSTAAQAIQVLGQRFFARKVAFEAVCTSHQTEELARQYGIPIIEPDPSRPLDIYLDGADEIDPQGRLIKGGGGALLREKLVAAMARRHVILVDESKLSARLGAAHAVPVEITRFAFLTTRWRVEQLGCEATLRMVGAAPFVSDEGHYILDCRFPQGLQDPERAHEQIKATLGVVDSGIFLGYCDEVIVGNTVTADHVPLSKWPEKCREILREMKERTSTPEKEH